MFALRDTLSDSNFSGRVNDVFSALGSGSVKQPDQSDKQDCNKSNLDKQKPNQSNKPTDRQLPSHQRRDEERKSRNDNSRFKHPAELLRAADGGGFRGGEGYQGYGGRGGNRGHGGRGGQGNRGRRVPDYKKNPGKWTKYSLADVDNMTDRSNTAAALQFLSTLKNKSEDDKPAFDPSQKVVFKKPSKKNVSNSTIDEGKERSQADIADTKQMETEEDNLDNSSADRPTFVGSKQVMPEYNFGAKRNKTKPEKSATKSFKPSRELKLSHLDEDGDE